MKVLGIDFETQGIDVENTNATEVGAVLCEVTFPGEDDSAIESWKVTKEENHLLWEPGYPPQPPDIVTLTGITDEMLRIEGRAPRQAFEDYIFPLIREADIVLAHNKKFDNGILNAVSKRNQLTPPTKRWLCTWSEMPYPPNITCKKLSHLGLEHGCKMDNRTLHRATDDVRLMFEIVSKYSLKDVIAYADEPNIVIRAVIPEPWKDKGVGKEAAYRLGYSWESPRNSDLKFPKLWVKQIKTSQLKIETDKAPFQVVQL